MTNTPPPTADESERIILGSIMLDPPIFENVVDLIEPKDFFSPHRRRIYEAMLAVYDGVYPPAIEAVLQALQNTGALEIIGGIDYVMEIASSVASPAAYPSSCANLVATTKKREILYHLRKVMAEIEVSPVGEAVDAYEGSMKTFAGEMGSDDSVSPGDFTEALVASQVAGPGSAPLGIPSGFTALDSYTGGFFRGEMTVLGGRPGMGKSSLAYNFALKVARQGFKVGIWSLEVSQQDISSTLHGILAGESLMDIRACKANPQTIERAGKALATRTLEIFDTTRLTPAKLRSQARRMKRKMGLDFLILDYIGLMSGGGKAENRQQEVSTISREIKNLARELDIHCLVLTQLNRGLESREDKRPRMSDIRESGSLEQDAENVMFAYREEVYTRDRTHEGRAELILSKQRNGRTGWVALRFEGRSKRFLEPKPTLMGG